MCFGGAEGDRTPDLRIANATLSQLSYGPMRKDGRGRNRECNRVRDNGSGPGSVSSRGRRAPPSTGPLARAGWDR